MAHRNVTPVSTRDEQLEALFGATKDTAVEVLNVIEADRSKAWQAEEIIDATGFRPMEVMVVLARLTAAGVVHHDGLGSGYTAANNEPT